MIGRSEYSSTGVGMLSHQIEQVLVETGAAVVFAHHFSKGNQSGKRAMDRMSGSGVFARDADTILTLTEHEEENCFDVEMILRNLPPQAPFVVEWIFPAMVERPDLTPHDPNEDEVESDEAEEYLLDLLQDRNLTTGQWEDLAGDFSRATFFRLKKQLKQAGKVSFNRRDKTWVRSAGVTDPEAAVSHKSRESHQCDYLSVQPSSPVHYPVLSSAASEIPGDPPAPSETIETSETSATFHPTTTLPATAEALVSMPWPDLLKPTAVGEARISVF